MSTPRQVGRDRAPVPRHRMTHQLESTSLRDPVSMADLIRRRSRTAGVATYHRADVGTDRRRPCDPRPARPSAGSVVLAVASVGLVATVVIAVARTGDRDPRRLGGLSRRDRRRGDRWAGPCRRHRDGARRVPRLRPAVHGAPAVTRDLGPGRAAQPRPGAHRRARGRAAGSARSSARGRGRPPGDRGDRALLRSAGCWRRPRPTTSVAAPIVDLLARDAALDRVWVGLDSGGREQVLADTGNRDRSRPRSIVTTLVRMPGDVPARWVRAHDPRRPDRAASERPPADGDVCRIKIETGGTVFGSLWARPADGEPRPRQEATRLLSLGRRPDGPRPPPRPTPPGGDQRRGGAAR